MCYGLWPTMRINFLRGFLIPGLLAITVFSATGQANLPIFTDRIVNGFQDWSWAPHNFNNTSPVHSGTNSISVTVNGAWQAISFHHGGYSDYRDGFDASVYGTLVFWANGDVSGGQHLQVYLQYGNASGSTYSLPTLAANSWQQFVIPLDSLIPAGSTLINRINIQLVGTAGTFYLDDIELTGKPAPVAVHLTVNAGQPLRVADSRWFGVNTAVWDGNFDTPQTISMLKEMGTMILRFPGGSLSDEYHWASNTTLTNTWKWSTSFANFMHVATNVGAQAVITVNYGTGTPAEAAAWVSNANLTNHLGFKYWEIGNEVYGTWETDTNTKPNDAFTYASRVPSYIQQMKTADPTIKVGVVVINGEDNYVNGNTNHAATNLVNGSVHYGWTPVLLSTFRSLGVTPDFAIYHRYPEYTPTGSTVSPESDALVLQSAQWPGDAANLRNQITDYFGAAGTNIELVCTENNSDAGAEGKQSTSLVNGLYYSDNVCQLMQTEFNGYFWWDLRNGSDTGGIFDPTLYGWRTVGDEGLIGGLNTRYPTFYAAKLLQYLVRPGDNIVGAASDYPLLTAYAARRTNGTVTLLVLNKDTTTNFNAQIALNGFSAASAATIRSYGIPQDTAAQTGIGSPDIAQTNFSGVGASFNYSFPPLSQTLFTFAPVAPSLTVMPAQTQFGKFVFQLQGQMGVPYVIQGSTNLVNWAAVSTNMLVGSTLNVTNTVPVGPGTQFWRALWQP